MLVYKTREKRENFFLYYTVNRVKNAVAFLFFLTFFLRFSRVLAHKPYQNAKPTHSVIWASGNAVILLFPCDCSLSPFLQRA